MLGSGKSTIPPFFRNSSVFFRNVDLKCQGKIIITDGLELNRSTSETIGILLPGVKEPNLSGLISPIREICKLENPQYCNKTLPFVEAPKPKIK